MTEQVAEPIAETTPEDEATDQVAEPKGLDNADEIANLRKRQAGADAARAVAERELAEARKQLAAYQAKEREAQDAGLSETAKLQARVEAAERRAAEAEKAAEARVLDKLYPNARKELPEVTDEVRLAKFEAMLKESEAEPETDTPRAMRAPKNSSSAPASQPSSKDIFAGLKGKSWSDLLPG